MKAWYFATPDEKLRHGDNRKIILGETHCVEGPPKLCEQGLHASERLIDALKYALGPILYLVELSGEFEIGADKICATKRTYLKRIDATKILKKFARRQALINIEKIKPYCSEDQYALILEYINTGKEDLRSAAESAVRSAKSAAEYAAWSAEFAARSATWSATWSAEFAARSAANEMLTEMIEKELNDV